MCNICIGETPKWGWRERIRTRHRDVDARVGDFANVGISTCSFIPVDALIYLAHRGYTLFMNCKFYERKLDHIKLGMVVYQVLCLKYGMFGTENTTSRCLACGYLLLWKENYRMQINTAE